MSHVFLKARQVACWRRLRKAPSWAGLSSLPPLSVPRAGSRVFPPLHTFQGQFPCLSKCPAQVWRFSSQRRKTPLFDLRHPAGSRGVASVGCRPLGSGPRPGFFPVLGAEEGKQLPPAARRWMCPGTLPGLSLPGWGGGGSGKIGTEPHSEGFGFLLFVFFLSLHPHFLVASTSGMGTSLPLGLLPLCQRTLGETLVILELMTGTQI